MSGDTSTSSQFCDLNDSNVNWLKKMNKLISFPNAEFKAGRYFVSVLMLLQLWWQECWLSIEKTSHSMSIENRTWRWSITGMAHMLTLVTVRTWTSLILYSMTIWGSKSASIETNPRSGWSMVKCRNIFLKKGQSFNMEALYLWRILGSELQYL